MDICIDFDGTCVSHEFPKVGKDIGATPVLKRLVSEGHRLVLFTMRSDIDNVTSEDSHIYKNGGLYLTDAVNWFANNNIPLYGTNSNPTQNRWTKSPKAYGELYIDDAALGCPLRYDANISSMPFVDWVMVENYLIKMEVLQVR